MKLILRTLAPVLTAQSTAVMRICVVVSWNALSPPARMLYLFAIGIPMMGVAAMLTFAPTPLYEWYALAPRLWGLSAVDDQRLGGLIHGYRRNAA